jgi:hypothetical protein
MLTTNKKSVYIGISSGFILQIVGIFVKSPIGISMNDALSAILFISGYFLLIWSCWLYAREKGYSGAWRLLGLFGLLGFVILFFLKDKSKQDL